MVMRAYSLTTLTTTNVFTWAASCEILAGCLHMFSQPCFNFHPWAILHFVSWAIRQRVNSQWPKSICYQLLHSVSIVFRGMVFHICISWRTQEISRVPRILSSKCENPKQRYWYHLCIEWNCVEKDGTVNISWLVKYFFDNLFVNNCVIVLKRRHNIGVIAPNWPSLKNEIILERWWWRHDD